MNKEEIAVNIIEADFVRNHRYFINVHGSSFSKNGTPDFIAHDKDGRILGIEVKRIGKMPEVNQWGKLTVYINIESLENNLVFSIFSNNDN